MAIKHPLTCGVRATSCDIEGQHADYLINGRRSCSQGGLSCDRPVWVSRNYPQPQTPLRKTNATAYREDSNHLRMNAKHYRNNFMEATIAIDAILDMTQEGINEDPTLVAHFRLAGAVFLQATRDAQKAAARART